MNHTSPRDESSRRHLLDRPTPDDYRRQWTERVAAEPETAAAGSVSVIIFRVGTEWLALPTGIFHETVQSYTIRSVPHHGGVLLGLVNVRGELLLCLELGMLVGAQTQANAAEGDARRQLLVLNWPGNRIAFPVDQVGGVERYHPSELIEAPATVARSSNGLILGVLHREDRAVGCLDEAALHAAANRSFA